LTAAARRVKLGVEVFMRKLIAGLAGVVLISATLAFAEAAAGSWTGFITDTHCGKNGANKDHPATCVEKCMKGGSKVQIWNDADQKAYNLDGFDKVKTLMGAKVTVKGTLDSASNTITVESAEKAP
jgi:hypothetical protein